MSRFTVYPAIDLRGGQVVRLQQGDYNQETVFSMNPVEVAKAWRDQRAEWLHVVDLDGAKIGKPFNLDVIKQITRKTNMPVQVGGGIRTVDDADALIDAGVSRVIIGTAAIEQPDVLRAILDRYADQVAVGIDARNGMVATRGWLETSEVKAEELAVKLASEGVSTFIFTDISRDGMMKGPNVEAIVAMAKACKRSVIASGGVSSIDDLLALSKHRNDGVSGAIVGKALYLGRVDLEDALDAIDDQLK